jgi:hypothetical protein
MIFSILWPTFLIHPQIKAVWDPLKGACVITNFQKCTATSTVLLAADVFFALVMLAGLLRLRRRGTGTLDLGRILWKQVGQERFKLTVMLLIHWHLILIFFRVAFG